jgi:hypothetical protein
VPGYGFIPRTQAGEPVVVDIGGQFHSGYCCWAGRTTVSARTPTIRLGGSACSTTYDGGWWVMYASTARTRRWRSPLSLMSSFWKMLRM